jgi:sulfide:quinone oxidoreductase
MRHRVVIIGAGSAGVSVAARLRRAGETDIAVIDPADTHYYQPLWTLVGGGCAPAAESARPQADVMPRGVHWIEDAAEAIDPDQRSVRLRSGIDIGYDYLVVCPGIQLDWGRIDGLEETLGANGISSNYRYDLAPKTWQFMRGVRGGTALFTMPAGPIKCAGAPQKIAYLCSDYWRQQGVLGDIHVILSLPTPGMFGVPEFARTLEQVVDRYGIDVRFETEVTAVDGDNHRATISSLDGSSSETVEFNAAHVVPPQSAPDWIKDSPVADPKNPGGYVEVDQYTLQHKRFDNIFSLGDVCSAPNSKTGAAIRKQAPVVVSNLLAVMADRHPTARYDGYASCPVTTARNRMLLAEFDYSLRPAPTFPVIDTTKERYDMWLLKRYGLPAMYWNGMLRGIA